MAQADRWTLKILALPIFDDAFAQAIVQTPLASIAFVIATGASSAPEFVDKVSGWSNSFPEGVADQLFQDGSKLETFWTLAVKAEKAFFESTSYQLGFGLCSGREPVEPRSPIDKLRKEARVKEFLNVPKGPSKRLKGMAPASASSTPLLDKENPEKAKWAARLEAIGRRAGAAAKLFNQFDQSEELSTVELSRLRQLVLLSGAPRTMAAHVGSFERFENWAQAISIPLYPITVDKILKYCLTLDQRECGPSVVPMFKTSLRWVTTRLAIDLPDLEDARLKALQDQIVAARATTLREAVPIPIVAVGNMESVVVGTEEFAQARLCVWWFLCMIFASLRFDDAIHVKPTELVMKEEGLFGVAWQTKVDRKRAGTRFMVPKVGFKHNNWLEVGWELFKPIITDRDYWMPELNTRSQFLSKPPSYQRSVQWLKCFAHQSVRLDKDLPEARRQVLLSSVQDITAHSCRVTLLDAAVHAGRSTEEIGLQANWKNPGPLVLKYTRNRSSVPATMIKQLVRDIVQKQHPAVEDADTVLVDAADVDLDVPEFFMKAPSSDYYDYKYHVVSLSDDTLTACNRLQIQDCKSVGNVLPDIAVFCKACSRARPEIACSYE